MTKLETITGHELTKTLAQGLGMSIADLLVLARGNDPYSIGTPAHIRDAIRRYQDSSMREKIRDVETQAQESVDTEWASQTQHISEEMEAIRLELAEIYAEYREPAKELEAKMGEALAPINERLKELREEFESIQLEFDPELPDKPAPEPDGPISDDPLFSSEREYLTQVTAFKRHGGAA